MIEWFRSTNAFCGVTAGQAVGIALMAVILGLLIYAYIKDATMVITTYDTGDEMLHNLRTGRQLKVRQEGIK